MAAVMLTPASSEMRREQGRMIPSSPASNHQASTRQAPRLPSSAAAAPVAATVIEAQEEQTMPLPQNQLQPQSVPQGCLCECWAGLEKYLPPWMVKKSTVAVVAKSPSIDPALMKEISEQLPAPVEMPTLLQSLRPEEGKESRHPSSRRHHRAGTEASSLVSNGEDALVVYSPKSSRSLLPKSAQHTPHENRERALPPVGLVPKKMEKGTEEEDAREIVLEGDMEVVPVCALFPSAPLPELTPGAREFLQVARSFIVDTSRRLESGTNDLIRWSWPHLVTAANGLQYYALEAATRTGDVVMHGWESWRIKNQGLGDQRLQGPTPPSTRASSLAAVGDAALGHAQVMPRIESLGEGSSQPEALWPSPSPDVPPLPHKQGTISLHSMRSSHHGGASPCSVRSAPAFVKPRQPGPSPSSAHRSPGSRRPSASMSQVHLNLQGLNRDLGLGPGQDLEGLEGLNHDVEGIGPTTADAAAAAANAVAAVAAAQAALGQDTPIGLTPLAAAGPSPARSNISGRSFGTLSRPSAACPPPPLPTTASGELSVASRSAASKSSAPPMPGRMRSGMVLGPLPGIDHSISNRSIVSNRSGGVSRGHLG